MRKIVMVLGLVAFAATPLVATATVMPTAMNTMLLEDSSDGGSAPVKVKHRGEFIPIGIAGVGAAVVAIVLANRSDNNQGNSPG